MPLFWQGALLSLSLCLDLGVVNLAAMRAGVRAGVMPSLALGIGSCFGDLVYAAAALAGVTRLMAMPSIRWMLWLGGTLVLVWLGAKALRDAWRGEGEARQDGPPSPAMLASSRYFWQGFALALASPSAIVWFATVGGAVIATSAGHAAGAVWTFFAGFFGAGVLWSVFVAVVSGQGRRFGPAFVRGFGVVSAAVFAGLAISVFVSGYRAFVSP